MIESTGVVEKKGSAMGPLSGVGLILRLEGLVLLGAAVFVYARPGFSWWAFALLLFVPDLSALGYLAGPRPGSVVYNAVHNLCLPLGLAVVAWAAGWTPGVGLSLIWLAHIGMDRALGYGLKYPDAFKHTHLDHL